jgi:hypothetical protein
MTQAQFATDEGHRMTRIRQTVLYFPLGDFHVTISLEPIHQLSSKSPFVNNVGDFACTRGY